MRRPPRSLEPVRLVRAFAASVATGALVYVLVIQLALPRLVAGLTDAQVDALRAAFRSHPFAVLAAMLLAAAVLTLPVLAAFRLAYGPLRDPDARGADG